MPITPYPIRAPMFRPRVARSPQGASICHRYRDWYIAIRPSSAPPCSARALRGLHKGLAYVVAPAIGYIVVRPLPHVPSAIAPCSIRRHPMFHPPSPFAADLHKGLAYFIATATIFYTHDQYICMVEITHYFKILFDTINLNT